MKQGHIIKGQVHDPHPAQQAAESDLVRLAREFESLKQQLSDNDDAIAEHRESQQGEQINFEMSMKHHEAKVAHLQRQRRTLEAQFATCNELLRPLIQQNDNYCGSTELRRY